ncbi:hypothetical protein FGG08_004507 [Glutinoglossum americanum]|uniref:non-specific serine/threonine protein kinase n=1 Tax=Glutinoglossum americanum TaxID=1670608 RepID=A0A9P8I0F2_9PEZI|nr:hypothetical protein FGG08_004507 [Glutinoglossum americanum]
MAEAARAMRKRYRRVRVLMITWEVDGISAPSTLQTRELAKIFREVYRYDVHEIQLALTVPDDPEYLKPHNNDENDLQIIYYFGNTETDSPGHWWKLTATPISQERQSPIPCPEPRCLGSLMLITDLTTDTLFILDCFLDGDGAMGWAFPDISNGGTTFELMAAGYKDRSVKPGAFSSYLAWSLDIAGSLGYPPLEGKPRKPRETISTAWLCNKISGASHILGQRVNPWHFGKDRDVPEAFIILDPNTLPFFDYGKHHALSVGQHHRIFGEKESIYEDGFTEIFKVEMTSRSQNFYGSSEDVVCAIKQFRPRNSRQASGIAGVFKRERENLLKLSNWRHPHILEFLGSFEVLCEGKFGHYDLILPYADGGDLHAFLRLPWAPGWLGQDYFGAVYNQTIGVVDALAFIHSVSSAGYIVHRDIKPSNILIHNRTFKLADFGLARLKSGEETSKTAWLAGTPIYAPPERTIEGQHDHGRARDVWALGCVMMEISILLAYGFCKPAFVKTFGLERLASSEKQDTRAFSQTMGCVASWMERLDKHTEQMAQWRRYRQGIWERRKKFKVLLDTISMMLQSDPLQRVESSVALKYLTSPDRLDDEPMLQTRSTE